MAIRAIVNHINNKYNDDGPNFFSITPLMKYHKEKVRKTKTMGAPPTIPMVLLNVILLHMKFLQLSKQRKASGKIIRNKIVAYAVGT